MSVTRLQTCDNDYHAQGSGVSPGIQTSSERSLLQLTFHQRSPELSRAAAIVPRLRGRASSASLLFQQLPTSKILKDPR